MRKDKKSDLYLWIRALSAKPSRQEAAKFFTCTFEYPAVFIWHQRRSESLTLRNSAVSSASAITSCCNDFQREQRWEENHLITFLFSLFLILLFHSMLEKTQRERKKDGERKVILKRRRACLNLIAEDDGPDESKYDCRISIDNIMRANIFQMHVLFQ